MKNNSAQKAEIVQSDEILEFIHPLYYRYEKTDIGLISQLALRIGDRNFNAIQEDAFSYNLTPGLSFRAKLKKGTEKNKGTLQISKRNQNII